MEFDIILRKRIKMNTNRPIIIAGAGPAGLSAAINLAKSGQEVIIYEKNPDVGLRYHGQIQGLENWLYDIDTIEWLDKLNLNIDLHCKSLYTMSLFSPDLKKFDLSGKTPIVYLLQRGNEDGCLDFTLKNYAETLGVKIKFNARIIPSNADIIATGRPKATYMASGINFKTNIDDIFWMIIDNELAPKGYGYFFSFNGNATIGSVINTDFINLFRYFEKTLASFRKLTSFKTDREKHFTGSGYFNINYNFNKLIVGEAAGFQDYLYGAGIKFAMHSGYLAAKSLNDITKYKELVKKEIYPVQKIVVVDRFFWEIFGNKSKKILFLLQKITHDKKIFKTIARFLYPLISIKYLLARKF